jgi:cobalt-zinc-cadmium efflux system membrane fusion protein
LIPATTPSSQAILGGSAFAILPKASPKRRLRRAVFTLAVLGAAVALLASWALHRSNHAVAAETPNAPRVDGKRILFSDRFAQHIKLESLAVGRSAVVPAFSVVGTVTFDPAHVARVGARLRGVVRDVYLFEGAKVKPGDVLATIDSPELGEAQAAVAMLGAQNHAAQLLSEREQGLAKRQLTTARYVEEAQAAADHSEALLAAARHRVSAMAGRKSGDSRRGLGVHVLSSPLNGTLIERHVAKGQLVDANHAAFLIADLDHVWVELSVFERVLPSIKMGDLVELHAEADGTDTTSIVKGEVAQIGAVLNPESRGAAVRVHVDNHARRFRPGQSVNAVIRATAATEENVTTIPASAVIYVDGEPSVFVADSPTSVIVTSVELGETNGQLVHVKSGVETGQRVVIHGTTELRNELFR